MASMRSGSDSTGAAAIVRSGSSGAIVTEWSVSTSDVAETRRSAGADRECRSATVREPPGFGIGAGLFAAAAAGTAGTPGERAGAGEEGGAIATWAPGAGRFCLTTSVPTAIPIAASTGARRYGLGSGAASLRRTRWRSPGGPSGRMMSRTAASIASSSSSPLTHFPPNLENRFEKAVP